MTRITYHLIETDERENYDVGFEGREDGEEQGGGQGGQGRKRGGQSQMSDETMEE
ncbi:MAG: hypothetical protein KW806_02675 [Candidatus Yanofskybacteria bacterium]|nr:hypothetical protein [Candidatus Yanofskybacteria bacterium]